MAIILSGKEVRDSFINNLKQEALDLFKRHGKKPTIACILVGNNSASTIYVKNKERLANKLGLDSIIINFPETITQDELIVQINDLNNTPRINGILIQLPLPDTFDTDIILSHVDPLKDVDVFHPYNMGLLWQGVGKLAPCTPLGIIEILKYYKLQIEGKRVVIIGRSNIVGKPLAALFLRNNGTVTVCHSKSKNLKEIAKEADILVAAIGKPKSITKEFIKQGAVVIDVGINRTPCGEVIGDVDFENVKNIASAITPVPGGVGLMTVAMLMYNTILLFKEQNK